MIIYVLVMVGIVCCIVSTILLCRTIKKQINYMENLINSAYVQLQLLKFISDAEVSNLWKIRQEIYNWQCQWAANDEYEAAQQAKIMIENIEGLINNHENIFKDNENN